MVSGWITCKAVFGKLVSIVSWLVWKNTTLTLVNAISGFCSKRSGSNLGNSHHQEPPQSQQQASLFCIRIGDWVLERKLMAFISQTIWSKNTILHFSLLKLSFCQVHLYAPLQFWTQKEKFSAKCLRIPSPPSLSLFWSFLPHPRN